MYYLQNMKKKVRKQTIPTFCPNDPSMPIGCGETAGEKGDKGLFLSEGFDQADQSPPDLNPSNPCCTSWKPCFPGKLPPLIDPTGG
jgi:hypothetical protein